MNADSLDAYFFFDDFFELDFFDEDFFDVDFFELDFFDDDFFDGTLPPARRASESPMAMACLRLVTFLPELPLFKVPRFRSCIAFSTLSCAFFPYFFAAMRYVSFRCAQETVQGTSPSIAVNVRAAREDGGSVLRWNVNFDRVRAAHLRVGFAHFELVMSGQRFLEAIDGDLREVEGLRVEAAGVAGDLSEPDLE
jgi:hypothetical protein